MPLRGPKSKAELLPGLSFLALGEQWGGSKLSRASKRLAVGMGSLEGGLRRECQPRLLCLGTLDQAWGGGGRGVEQESLGLAPRLPWRTFPGRAVTQGGGDPPF